ncbi:lipoprotein insertase outer membrane protein LolB [Marinomonas transparens]|uniref:Outer-membrane lipoprotein LolB n=1 Tax=Marinomonas transparens TaxID=2795388 RepID=A0A934N6Q7_9GAMM|nr:lipoprotein insertase outer membrane protein LolB [Marinomonas transparens]MBJ7538286.1 outer membrane lipoprotein LolB [Marinomonas transparens]
MIYRFLSTLALVLLLAACSSNQTGPTTPPPQSIAAISTWETSGRVGIRTQEDAVSGNFTWQKSPTGFSLDIIGPFGQGATKLKSTTDGQVTLAYKDTEITGPNAAILLQQELGWVFPVDQVSYWIRGLAYPQTPSRMTKNSDNLPNKIEQDGWLVTYKNFTKVDGLSLPQKMQVSNPPFRVNLIINQWTIQ